MKTEYLARASDGREITLIPEVEYSEYRPASGEERKIPTCVRVATDDGFPVQHKEGDDFIVLCNEWLTVTCPEIVADMNALANPGGVG